jgi:hypothetical protein
MVGRHSAHSMVLAPSKAQPHKSLRCVTGAGWLPWPMAAPRRQKACWIFTLLYPNPSHGAGHRADTSTPLWMSQGGIPASIPSFWDVGTWPPATGRGSATQDGGSAVLLHLSRSLTCLLGWGHHCITGAESRTLLLACEGPSPAQATLGPKGSG